jgi:hypothetical protein
MNDGASAIASYTGENTEYVQGLAHLLNPEKTKDYNTKKQILDSVIPTYGRPKNVMYPSEQVVNPQGPQVPQMGSFMQQGPQMGSFMQGQPMPMSDNNSVRSSRSSGSSGSSDSSGSSGSSGSSESDDGDKKPRYNPEFEKRMRLQHYVMLMRICTRYGEPIPTDITKDSPIEVIKEKIEYLQCTHNIDDFIENGKRAIYWGTQIITAILTRFGVKYAAGWADAIQADDDMFERDLERIYMMYGNRININPIASIMIKITQSLVIYISQKSQLDNIKNMSNK